MLFLAPKISKANDSFVTDQTISYTFDESGMAEVTHDIKLTNKLALVYAKDYILTLPVSITDTIIATDANGNILQQVKTGPESTQIFLHFDQPNIGKDATTEFQIHYKLLNLITQKGKTKELLLPLSPQSDTTDIIITAPLSYGQIAYTSLSPSNQQSTPSMETFEFRYTAISKKILIAFGDNQIFDFDLSYFLDNPSDKTITKEIAIPPSVDYQKVILKSINPPPLTINADADGNWLAQYTLTPWQKLAITVTGQVKIINESTKTSINPADYLKSTNFWPTQAEAIKTIAATLTTPRSIYDYVTTTLNYDYSQIDNATRKGALATLNAPNLSLCTDFTDLFVTLARAKGIPAREVEGYAYTNNPKIKPINENADILHAWPQYYDQTTKSWKSIDPTWGKTTNGIDFFTDLDLNHITFVIHGQSDSYPPPPGSYRGSNNQKTVNISFATNEIHPNILPLSIVNQTIINPNTVAINHLKLTSSNPPWSQKIDMLPPFSHFKIAMPSPNFPQIILPSAKSTALQLMYDETDLPQTIIITNQQHYLYLSIAIATTIVILCLCGILITKHK